MRILVLSFICCGFFLLPDAAFAYVGPGAGLSLLGALWALLVALGTAILFVIAWPIRRLRRLKRDARERTAREAKAAATPAGDDKPIDERQPQRQ